MTTTELCDICGHSLVWHQTNKPRHMFNADPSSLNATPPRVEAESAPFQPVGAQQAVQTHTGPLFDPVLRMALVNAGVITVEQIDAAQRMFNTLNGVANEQAHFQSPDIDG